MKAGNAPGSVLPAIHMTCRKDRGEEGNSVGLGRRGRREHQRKLFYTVRRVIAWIVGRVRVRQGRGKGDITQSVAEQLETVHGQKHSSHGNGCKKWRREETRSPPRASSLPPARTTIRDNAGWRRTGCRIPRPSYNLPRGSWGRRKECFLGGAGGKGLSKKKNAIQSGGGSQERREDYWLGVTQGKRICKKQTLKYHQEDRRNEASSVSQRRQGERKDARIYFENMWRRIAENEGSVLVFGGGREGVLQEREAKQ